MPSTLKATAFFSYSREDSEFALRLAEDLRKGGASVWLDQLDIEPGQEWDSAIEDAVTRCERMLVILSPASVKSRNVRNELAVALDEGKGIIPVFYRDCAVPLQMRRIQYADFRTDYACGLNVLLKSLGVGQQLGTATVADAFPLAGEAPDSDIRKQEQTPTSEAADNRQAPALEIPTDEHKGQHRSGAAAADDANHRGERQQQQERSRIEPPRPTSPLASKSVVLGAVVVLLVAAVLYWALRPKEKTAPTPTVQLQSQPSGHPLQVGDSARAMALAPTTPKSTNSAEQRSVTALRDCTVSILYSSDMKPTADKLYSLLWPMTHVSMSPTKGDNQFFKGKLFYFRPETLAAAKQAQAAIQGVISVQVVSGKYNSGDDKLLALWVQ